MCQVSIVAFKKGQLRVLSHAWDRNLGGRDFDNILFDYFAKEFQEKYKLDVRTNLRGSFRLRVACEKACEPASCVPSSGLQKDALLLAMCFILWLRLASKRAHCPCQSLYVVAEVPFQKGALLNPMF
jgi:hypothetical protein